MTLLQAYVFFTIPTKPYQVTKYDVTGGLNKKRLLQPLDKATLDLSFFSWLILVFLGSGSCFYFEVDKQLLPQQTHGLTEQKPQNHHVTPPPVPVTLPTNQLMHTPPHMQMPPLTVDETISPLVSPHQCPNCGRMFPNIQTLDDHLLQQDCTPNTLDLKPFIPPPRKQKGKYIQFFQIHSALPITF